MTRSANVVQLKPETKRAFAAHIREAEAVMDETLYGSGSFLWADADLARTQLVRRGDIVAQFFTGQSPARVPAGLIHDWIGAVFIPGTTVDDTLAVVQDYDHHKNIYKPEVIDSVLVSRRGNHFKIRLRLLKKKVVTVVLETDHDVQYSSLDRMRWICRSQTTRIAEVDNPGELNETVLPPDTGHGFLWRLYSYWRFQEKKEGVYVECRGISLTRDVPFGLGWLIEPIIQKLPRESLVNTLEATRRALRSRSPRTQASPTSA
jgi:hypothetical protein